MIKKTLLVTGFSLLSATSLSFAEDAAKKVTPTAEQQEAMQKMIAQMQSQQKAAPKMSLEEAKEYFSKSVGIGLGSQLKDDKMVDKAVFLKSFNEALEGKVDETSIDQAKYQAAQSVIQAAAVEKLKKEGEEYLTANKAKEGVKVTASGLQYKVNTAGEGASPIASDQVKVHYTGKLVDGTVFDSSVDRGEPVTFPLGGVIKGWTEGLQLMKKGAKYEFTIPSDLAYGANGSGRSVPPHATLIFTVELLDIIKPEAKPATPAPAAEPAPAK